MYNIRVYENAILDNELTNFTTLDEAWEAAHFWAHNMAQAGYSVIVNGTVVDRHVLRRFIARDDNGNTIRYDVCDMDYAVIWISWLSQTHLHFPQFAIMPSGRRYDLTYERKHRYHCIERLDIVSRKQYGTSTKLVVRRNRGA